jgi:hypothetical protein
MDTSCPVCPSGKSKFHAAIDGYDYFQCGTCQSLHIAVDELDAIDSGERFRLYDEAYWAEELRSARERATGVSLVRVGEALLYAVRPIHRFLDIGTGPGYLLDELNTQFPEMTELFHGVELFPPEQHTAHRNYHIGEIGDLPQIFDGGVCIEVLEHLTPRMLGGLVRGLAKVSAAESVWLFNTGMPDYVLTQDPGYLDPLRRGHIVSYSVAGMTHIFEPHGFRLSEIPGKNYAFIAEFEPRDQAPDFEQRYSQPVAENLTLLKQSGLMYMAAFESARASYYHREYLARTHWALSLQKELDELKMAR